MRENSKSDKVSRMSRLCSGNGWPGPNAARSHKVCQQCHAQYHLPPNSLGSRLRQRPTRKGGAERNGRKLKGASGLNLRGIGGDVLGEPPLLNVPQCFCKSKPRKEQNKCVGLVRLTHDDSSCGRARGQVKPAGLPSPAK